MNTVTIELETMLENKHGKLLVNKDWHVFTIEAEDPEAFLKSIPEKLDILHTRIDPEFWIERDKEGRIIE